MEKSYKLMAEQLLKIEEGLDLFNKKVDGVFIEIELLLFNEGMYA